MKYFYVKYKTGFLQTQSGIKAQITDIDEHEKKLLGFIYDARDSKYPITWDLHGTSLMGRDWDIDPNLMKKDWKKVEE